MKLIEIVQPQPLVQESKRDPGRIQHPEEPLLRWDIIPKDTGSFLCPHSWPAPGSASCHQNLGCSSFQGP